MRLVGNSGDLAELVGRMGGIAGMVGELIDVTDAVLMNAVISNGLYEIDK